MSKKQKTHLKISERLVGKPIEILDDEKAIVELDTTEEMVVDDFGLIHGGFTIGLADYAAMLAVNDPFVVLGEVNVRLLAPVKIGEKLLAVAEIIKKDGKKREINTEVLVENKIVLKGKMICFKMEKHILSKI